MKILKIYRNWKKGKVKIENEFVSRILFSDMRPVEYKEYKPFFRLDIEIDKYIKKILEKPNSFDSDNGNILNNIINERAEKAKGDIIKQFEEHKDTIDRISTRRKADQKAFEKHLIFLEEEIKRLEDEKRKLR